MEILGNQTKIWGQLQKYYRKESKIIFNLFENELQNQKNNNARVYSQGKLIMYLSCFNFLIKNPALRPVSYFCSLGKPVKPNLQIHSPYAYYSLTFSLISPCEFYMWYTFIFSLIFTSNFLSYFSFRKLKENWYSLFQARETV